jgi:hypothetical protein
MQPFTPLTATHTLATGITSTDVNVQEKVHTLLASLAAKADGRDWVLRTRRQRRPGNAKLKKNQGKPELVNTDQTTCVEREASAPDALDDDSTFSEQAKKAKRKRKSLPVALLRTSTKDLKVAEAEPVPYPETSPLRHELTNTIPHYASRTTSSLEDTDLGYSPPCAVGRSYSFDSAFNRLGNEAVPSSSRTAYGISPRQPLYNPRATAVNVKYESSGLSPCPHLYSAPSVNYSKAITNLVGLNLQDRCIRMESIHSTQPNNCGCITCRPISLDELGHHPEDRNLRTTAKYQPPTLTSICTYPRTVRVASMENFQSIIAPPMALPRPAPKSPETSAPPPSTLSFEAEDPAVHFAEELLFSGSASYFAAGHKTEYDPHVSTPLEPSFTFHDPGQFIEEEMPQHSIANFIVQESLPLCSVPSSYAPSDTTPRKNYIPWNHSPVPLESSAESAPWPGYPSNCTEETNVYLPIPPPHAVPGVYAAVSPPSRLSHDY